MFLSILRTASVAVKSYARATGCKCTGYMGFKSNVKCMSTVEGTFSDKKLTKENEVHSAKKDNMYHYNKTKRKLEDDSVTEEHYTLEEEEEEYIPEEYYSLKTNKHFTAEEQVGLKQKGRDSNMDFGSIVELDYVDILNPRSIKENKESNRRNFGKKVRNEPSEERSVTTKERSVAKEERSVKMDDFSWKNLNEADKQEVKDGINDSKSNKKLIYHKFQYDTKMFNRLMSQIKNKSKRQELGLILLEGKRLIEDAINSGQTLEGIFVSKISDAKSLNLPADAKVCKLFYKIIEFWSDTKTPQGVMAIFRLSDPTKVVPCEGSIPVTIICDNIRDPTNMAAVLRVAASVGCKKLILTKGCADIWEQKVLRGACGAHFRVPIFSSLTWQEIEPHIEKESVVCLADSDMPADIKQIFDKDLNQAGESKKLTKEEGMMKAAVMEKRRNEFQKRHMLSSNMPLLTYFSKKYWSGNSVVIIIGGETEGLSEEAYQIGMKFKADRVYVPMLNGVESLNSGVALAIVAYEVRKQYMLNESKSETDQVSQSETYSSVGLYSE